MNTSLLFTRRFGIMMISLVAAILFLTGFLFMAAKAGAEVQAAQPMAAANPEFTDMVIVANMTGTINIIDTATDIVYGPFLSGSLGTEYGGLLDVAVTPDGNTALISNFGDRAIFFVDVADPLNPSFIVSVTVPMWAEDIAISRDGKFALVTDGGLSSMVASIDLISRSVVYTTDLGTRDAQAVDIAPDGTVVLADYLNGEVHTMLLDASGVLSYTGSYSYTIGPDGSVSENVMSAMDRSASPIAVAENSPQSPQIPVAPLDSPYIPWPINVFVAPDGQTVLVCNAFPYTSTGTSEEFALYSMGVYRISAPGVLSFSGAITELNRATQSVAFNPAGNLAYLAGNGGNIDNMKFDQLSILEITAPGEVHLVQNGLVDYPRVTGGQYFGVDTIAIANGKAYLGYPTSFGYGDYNDIRIINLDDFSAKKRTVFGYPNGVAVIPIHKIYLPIVINDMP